MTPTQTPPKSDYPWRRFISAFWRLARPYWSSEEKWSAWGLLSLMVALTLTSVYIAYAMNQWRQKFYDVFQNYQADAFGGLILRFTELAVIAILANVLSQYFEQVLQNRWRRWMTRRLLDQWLTDKSHYLWHLEAAETDNPDQRIAEDVNEFVFKSLDLSLGLLNQVVTFFTFLGVLWALSGPLSVPLGQGRSLSVPGYLAWICLFYALAGTWLAQRVGKPLVGLNYRRQRTEANFRFALVRLRENGESIAFSDGEAVEGRQLQGLFDAVFLNFKALIRRQMFLGFAASGYDQVAEIFPYLVLAPRYFAKAISLGVVFQTQEAFSQVKDSLSWVVTNFEDLAYWRSVVQRLEGFESEVERTKDLRRRAESILTEPYRRGPIQLKELQLSLPGQAQPFAGPMNLSFEPGHSVLISGPTGCGKSTLLRALNGLWPFSQGKVLLPMEGTRMTLPQKPYLPIGTLRAALCYPAAADAVPDAELQQALDLCRLGHLRPQLELDEHWSLILSGGEQQRVAWARVFLQKPDWLFLDEATSALDEETQAALYRALAERLPQTAVISVAHSQNPAQHHQRVWEFGR